MKTRLTPLLLLFATVISVCGDLDAWNNGTNSNIRVGGVLATSITNAARTASTFVVAGADKSDTSTAASSVLASTLTDETGTGVAVFGTSPTITTPTFVTSLTLTNAASGTNAVLVPDAANTLALRNGSNAQGLNIYNTYTDASNWERLDIHWVSNGLWFEIDKLGTGSGRDIFFRGAAGRSIYFGVAGNQWQINSAGHLLAPTDNAYDIGASGATRPRTLYLAGGIVAAGSAQLSASSYYFWDTRSLLSSPSNGNILLQNNAATDFARLQFGGTSASFPSLKRSTTNIVVRLADDSADTVIQAQGVSTTSSIAAVAIASGGWTNTFGMNAHVMLDGTGVTYTLYNAAGTAVYTNAATVANATIPLQAGAKVLITAGTGITGVAVPW